MHGYMRADVVGCFLEYDGKFLILQRTMQMPQGGRWGLPAGKVESGETERSAIIREVHEETGFVIPQGKLEFLRKLHFDFAGKILDFSVFRVKPETEIYVALEPAVHQTYAWISGKECYARNDLIDGVHKLLRETGYAA